MMSKAQQLKKYKLIALMLLVLMGLIYISSYLFLQDLPGIGYIRAFAEAAMVGALADWFAVSALFRHPLGIPIPHTNLIENSKKRIGENLGGFITENFLSPAAIRPRVQMIRIAYPLSNWLGKDRNRKIVLDEINRMLLSILQDMDDEFLRKKISREAGKLIKDIPSAKWVSKGMMNILEQGIHQQWITKLSENLENYIVQNQDLIREKVKAESHFLIPGFVDNIIAAKLIQAAISFCRELREDPEHRTRMEISDKLYAFAKDLPQSATWESQFAALIEHWLSPQRLEEFSLTLVSYIKSGLETDLSSEDSSISKYLDKMISDFSVSLQQNVNAQQKMDSFVQLQAYKLFLRHRHRASSLISQTIGNWKGRELSDKLELEVGKDLQYIRLNGTMVGGLVGLIIYTLTRILT